jgi:hypothetical protein
MENQPEKNNVETSAGKTSKTGIWAFVLGLATGLGLLALLTILLGISTGSENLASMFLFLCGVGMLIGTLGLGLVSVTLRKIAQKKGEATESGKRAMMVTIGILCGVLAPIILFLFLFRGSIALGW